MLVPLLTLGLPTTATAAIIIAALQSYGIQPGPRLFDSQPGLVWAMIASLYIGNLMLLVLNLPLVGMWVKVLQIPRPYLYAGILTFAAFGSFSLSFSTVDIIILLILGVIGFFMRRYGYPVSPMVIGMILGPMAERQLRRALQLSQGDLLTLVESPVAIVLYVALAVLMAVGFWLKARQKRFEQVNSEPLTGTLASQATREKRRKR